MNIETKKILYKGKKISLNFEYSNGSLKVKEVLLLKQCKKCGKYAIKVRYENNTIEWIQQK